MHQLERFFLNMMLISLIASPIVALIANWWRMGGRILLIRHPETGRIRGIQFIPSASLIRWFISDARSEKPCTKTLKREEVLMLPEVEFDPSIHGSMAEDEEDRQTNTTNSTDTEEERQAESSSQQSTCQISSNNIKPMGTGCSVCLEDFDPGEKVRMLPCFHLYHLDCILPWLTERQGVCPMCKQHVLHRHRRAASIRDSADETLVVQSTDESSSSFSPGDSSPGDDRLTINPRADVVDLELGSRDLEISRNNDEQVSPISSFNGEDEASTVQNPLNENTNEGRDNTLSQSAIQKDVLDAYNNSALEKLDKDERKGKNEKHEKENRQDEYPSPISSSDGDDVAQVQNPQHEIIIENRENTLVQNAVRKDVLDGHNRLLQKLDGDEGREQNETRDDRLTDDEEDREDGRSFLRNSEERDPPNSCDNRGEKRFPYPVDETSNVCVPLYTM